MDNDKIIKAYQQLISWYIEDLNDFELNSKETQAYIGGVEDCIKVLEQFKIKEIKHGHWNNNINGQECSVCGEEQYGFDNFRNYCANCGAKMDLKGE